MNKKQVYEQTKTIEQNEEKIKRAETAEDHLKFLLKIGWKKESVIIRKFCKDNKLNINEYKLILLICKLRLFRKSRQSFFYTNS